MKAESKSRSKSAAGAGEGVRAPTPSSFFIRHSLLFFLVLVLLAPFAALLLHPAGRVLGNPHCDNPGMFYFINAFAAHCWRAGIVPLWNPHIMLGLPFLGEGQAAIFHPLSWLFILLPTGVAINWLIALSFLASGLFFYGYLRAIELSPAAAAGGALAWSFSTILGGRIYAGHLTILLELIEVPAIMMFWELYRRQRGIQHLFGLGAAYGLMALAAYPQILYIFSLFLLLYAAVQSAPDLLNRTARGEAWRGLRLLGFFMLLGVGIGAAQLLPTADFAGESARAKTTLEFCGLFSFPPENLLGLVAPRFFGYSVEEGPAPYWGRDLFWEMSIYIGVLPLILAFPGVLAAPRRRRTALLVCGGIFTAVALGNETPLFGWLYHVLPGFSYFRGPSKYMLGAELCAITFSAYGIEELLHPQEGPRRRRFLYAALAGGILALVAAGTLFAVIRIYFNPATMNVKIETVRMRAHWAQGELLRTLLWIVLALAVIFLGWASRARKRRALTVGILALTLADLLWIFLPLMDQYPESLASNSETLLAPLRAKPYPARVLGPMRFVNMAMRDGYATASGYAGNVLARYNNFVNTSFGATTDTLQLIDPVKDYHPNFRIFAFDYVMLSEANVKPGLDIAAHDPPNYLVRIPNPFPRAFLAQAPRAAAFEPEALTYATTLNKDLQTSPVVEQLGFSGIEPEPVEANEGARIVAFTPNRVELEVRAAHRRLLVLCEAYEKNWTATVGGKPAHVLPVNYLFRGVVTPSGTSRVVFEYRPASFRIGAVISLTSVCGALVAGLWLWRRKRKLIRDSAPSEEGARLD